MQQRIFAAAIKLAKNNSHIGLKERASKLFGAPQILLSSWHKFSIPSTIITNLSNIATEPAKFSYAFITRGMSQNIEGESLASNPAAAAEEDINQPEGLNKVSNLDSWWETEDELETLRGLEESYQAARQELASKWLDYNKTCYIYLYRGGGEPSGALAGFDLDGTIIKPKSNKRIPKSATDWQFFSVWTKVKLQQALRENQARFVIFTNQNGVGLKLVPLEEVQERIELVTKRLNIPCTVFVAIDKDEFRKPNVGMFHLFRRSFNGSMNIDKERSFYCGDAVGEKSHSDADIKFAQTLRLPFLPPEKFLRGVKPKLIEVEGGVGG